MRISDWSSDVCSSDLLVELALLLGIFDVVGHPRAALGLDADAQADDRLIGPGDQVADARRRRVGEGHRLEGGPRGRGSFGCNPGLCVITSFPVRALRLRSEEHTSELQSQMSIS